MSAELSFEEIDPDLKRAVMERVNLSPYWSLLGMRLLDMKKGWAVVALPFSDKLLQSLGIVHGEAICSVADSAIGLALKGLLDPGEVFVTAEIKLNFIKSFERGEVQAAARIVHRGATTALGEVDVRNGAGELVAKGLATFIVRKTRDEEG
ncbi:MAG: PaaI family thioesterase [Deltaproteobacteria bacterium]|nr:PaaI family thioesterase [Deltaproteobacteria bacterium]